MPQGITVTVGDGLVTCKVTLPVLIVYLRRKFCILVSRYENKPAVCLYVQAQKGEMQSKFNSKLVEIKETVSHGTQLLSHPAVAMAAESALFVVQEEKGMYKVSKLVESRQANMTHGLVRCEPPQHGQPKHSIDKQGH